MYHRLILACLLVILLCSCGSDATGISPPVLPHDPVDAAWKAVENFEYAYDTQDIALVLAILDTDFMHHLDEEDWADYDGDGIIDTFFDLELEQLFTEYLFDAAEEIEMTFTGDDEWVWSGDTTGQSLELRVSSADRTPMTNGVSGSCSWHRHSGSFRSRPPALTHR